MSVVCGVFACNCNDVQSMSMYIYMHLKTLTLDNVRVRSLTHSFDIVYALPEMMRE